MKTRAKTYQVEDNGQDNISSVSSTTLLNDVTTPTHYTNLVRSCELLVCSVASEYACQIKYYNNFAILMFEYFTFSSIKIF